VRRPFGGPNDNALILSIIEDAPALITELGAGDEELWGILKRGLARRPR
jgi:eukaryotic-like serine/threonine-protein kinase